MNFQNLQQKNFQQRREQHGFLENVKKNQLFLLQIIIFFAFVGMTLPYPTIAPMFLLNDPSQTSIFFVYPISNKVFSSIVLGVYPLGLFFGGLLMGGMFNKYLKNLLLLYSLSFSIITQIVSGILVFQELHSWLVISRFFSGAFEGNIVIARATLAVICTTESLKSKHFGRMNAAMTLGWTFGALTGGLISHLMPSLPLGYSIPYFVGAFFGLSVFLIVLFYFNEPNISDYDGKLIKNSKTKTITRKKTIYLMLAALFITLGVDTFYQFLPLYLSGYFNYDALWVGIMIALVALFNGFSNLFLVPFFASKIRSKYLLLVFLFFMAFSLLWFVINVIPLFHYFILACIGISIGLIMTSMTVLLSLQVSNKSQGKLMGVLLSQRTLGTAFISIALIPLLQISYKLPLIAGAFLLLAGAFIIAILAPVHSNNPVDNASKAEKREKPNTND